MSVHVSPLANGKYRVDIRFRWPDGSVYRERPNVDERSFAAARKWGERREAELRAAGKPEPESPGSSQTFTTFADEWIDVYPAKKGLAPMTLREKKSHLSIILKPYFGGSMMTPETFAPKKLDAFVAAVAQGSVGTMRRPAKAKYVNNILATLSVMLKTAVDWGTLPHLPKLPRQKADEPSFDFLVRSESDLVLSKARDPEERALLTFAFHTGARAGEMLALQWTAIDWHNELVTFKRSSSLGIVSERTKSKRVRKVPMTETLVVALKAIKHLKGPLVFCGEKGQPLTIDMLREHLWTCCRRAGLREIRWHDTRHSFASQLVSAGTPLRLVQEWLGHSTIQMTMRYAHLAPGGGREFLSALDGQPTARQAGVAS